MPPSLKIRLNNNLDAVPRSIEKAEKYLNKQGLKLHDIYRLELVLEELVTNIIKYGYKDSQTHEISIELSLTPESIRLQIIDDADPFDPTSPTSKPKKHPPLEERSVGGIGLLLVKKLAKTFCYERIGEKNKQTLTLERS